MKIKKHQERVSAKNKLEQYAYGIRTTISDEKTKDKVSASDKATIEEAIKDVTTWLDRNESASVSDYEDKLKEVEGKCQPIIMKIYQAGGAPGGEDGGAPGGASSSGPSSTGGAAGPTVEEVD
jgi:heat shock protein 1/8